MRVGTIELGALVWGFAEATLFFIVPDVWLTGWAIRSPKRAFIACVFALFGALGGGTVMYQWGRHDPQGALRAVELVPAISGAMVEQVSNDIETNGAWAMFEGPVRGRPYKLYAVTAGTHRLSYVTFLAVSVPARLVRFVVMTLITVAVVRYTRKWVSHRALLFVWFMCWVLTYLIYFLVMQG